MGHALDDDDDHFNLFICNNDNNTERTCNNDSNNGEREREIFIRKKQASRRDMPIKPGTRVQNFKQVADVF